MDDDVRKAINAIKGHLGDIQGETRANTRDLKSLREEVKSLITAVIERIDLMATRMDNIDGHLTEVRGAFSSIETHLVKTFESDDSASKRLDEVEARLDALEDKEKAS